MKTSGSFKNPKVQTDFELALTDFGFCLNKALESVVSQDMSEKSEDVPRMNDSQLRSEII